MDIKSYLDNIKKTMSGNGKGEKSTLVTDISGDFVTKSEKDKRERERMNEAINLIDQKKTKRKKTRRPRNMQNEGRSQNKYGYDSKKGRNNIDVDLMPERLMDLSEQEEIREFNEYVKVATDMLDFKALEDYLSRSRNIRDERNTSNDKKVNNDWDR